MNRFEIPVRPYTGCSLERGGRPARSAVGAARLVGVGADPSPSMRWYCFLWTTRILIPPYTQTIQDFFYATEGFARKAQGAWGQDTKLFAFDASTSTWTEVKPFLTA